MSGLRVQDPLVVGGILLILALAMALVVPSFAMEVILTLATSAIIAPGVQKLRRKLRLSLGLTVALIVFLIVALLGVGGYYGIPLFIRGINETLATLPESLRKLAPFVQEWLASAKVRLEGLFPSDTSIDELIKKKLPEVAGSTGPALRMILVTVFGSAVARGHLLLGLVLVAILVGEWDKNVEKLHYLLRLFAPRQAPALIRFGEKFQSYGVELFFGIGTVMVIFMPVFFALLYFYAGLPLGKSLLFGVILGFTSAIPTIGGIITYLILVLVGILNLGLEWEGIRKTAVMYAVAFIVHLAETKYVTPKVLGHRISFTSYAVVTVLVGSVFVFGVAKGILAGLFLLVAMKALVELADEGARDRHARASEPAPASSPGSPAPALAAVSAAPAVATGSAQPVATVGGKRLKRRHPR